MTLSLVACAPRAPGNVRYRALAMAGDPLVVHTRPTTKETTPWKLGDWAVYRHVMRGEVSFTRISVFAVDQCGTWFELAEERPRARVRVLACLRPPADPARPDLDVSNRIRRATRQIDNEPPEVFPYHHGPDVWSWREILGARWLALQLRPVLPDQNRGDIKVAAGQFLGAFRESVADSEVWTHTDAPFGGVVKIRERAGELEHELVEFGANGPGVFETIRGVAGPSREVSRVSFALGIGHSETAGDGRWTGGMGALATAWSVRVAQTLDVVADMGATSEGTSDPATTQGQLLASVGARYSPFREPPRAERARYDFRAVYVQAGVGYAELSRWQEDSKTTAHGIAASAAIGWLPMQGRDWALGLELADRSGFYFSGEGTHHNIFVLMQIRLFMRMLMR